MLPLADLQHAFTDALLTGGGIPAAITGTLRPDEAMRIHRNTVLAALAQALRLSHPTVDALVGEAFFDQAALAFIALQPPRTPSLALYGEGFAEFLAGFAPTLPYLPDVARLDFAIERVLQSGGGTRRFALDASVTMALPTSLTLLAPRYPAAAIRAAIGDDTALAAINLDPAEQHLLVWRDGAWARLHAIDAASARFVQALLAGLPAADALATAGDDAIAQIQTEIFSAQFCTIIPEGPAS